MNVDQGNTPTAETDDDDTAPQEPRDTVASLSKFDAPTLRAIGVSEVSAPGLSAFLPTSMGEAMEFAKLMAASNFVPPHLRGQPGDCLAIVLQSVRWGADPYAVANKTYFVNNRMAFEAQLVAAVVNTSKILDGRLQVSWQGNVGKPAFQCTVRGRIKGDNDIHELIQEIDTITTRNSPLWKQSQRVQLGYYTMRAWSRLYTPEVLLGIYTPDEILSIAGEPANQTVIPPRPTRTSVSAEQAAAMAEQLAREEAEAAARAGGRMPDDDDGREEDGAGSGDGTPPHDPKTGELHEEPKPKVEPAKPAEPKKDTAADHANSAKALIDKFKRASKRSALEALVEEYAMEIDVLRTESRSNYDAVMAAVGERRRYFEK